MRSFKRLFVLLVILQLVFSEKRKSGEVSYQLVFDKDVAECDDFDNKIIDARELSLAIDGSTTALSGFINSEKDVLDGVQIMFTIFKMTPVGQELFAEIEADFCEHLDDSDMPWAPLFEALGITECPIPSAKYELDDLTLSLEFAEGLLRREMVGQYIANMILLKGTSDMDTDELQFSCYTLALSIIESDEEGGEDE